ncbi:MAG TPA: hypothetical protein VGS62_08310, partial [Streptosporangiaceae bacterium]|nr:hypothetical protein [Streptosporangiaceae bacterium]
MVWNASPAAAEGPAAGRDQRRVRTIQTGPRANGIGWQTLVVKVVPPLSLGRANVIGRQALNVVPPLLSGRDHR